MGCDFGYSGPANTYTRIPFPTLEILDFAIQSSLPSSDLSVSPGIVSTPVNRNRIRTRSLPAYLPTYQNPSFATYTRNTCLSLARRKSSALKSTRPPTYQQLISLATERDRKEAVDTHIGPTWPRLTPTYRRGWTSCKGSWRCVEEILDPYIPRTVYMSQKKNLTLTGLRLDCRRVISQKKGAHDTFPILTWNLGHMSTDYPSSRARLSADINIIFSLQIP